MLWCVVGVHVGVYVDVGVLWMGICSWDGFRRTSWRPSLVMDGDGRRGWGCYRQVYSDYALVCREATSTVYVVGLGEIVRVSVGFEGRMSLISIPAAAKCCFQDYYKHQWVNN